MATVLRSRCAFARFFIGKTEQILNNFTDFGIKLSSESISVYHNRNFGGHYEKMLVSKFRDTHYKYEVVKCPSEWSYVERLMPLEYIPQVKPKEQYPSGWIPPKEEAKNLPYFLNRTKNHEVPIYLQISYRGIRRISIIKKIEGDIWVMNDEIKAYLKNKHKRYVETRVHELGRFIEVKGDFVLSLRDWAYSLGF